MRDDIIINPDGCYRLESGDFTKADITAYIKQKIYAALMSMPPNVVSGVNATHLDVVETSLRQYLNNRLMGDPDIQKDLIKVVAVPNGTPQGLTLTVEVSVTAPDGTPVDTSVSTDYSISGGSLKSVDFSPSWLEHLNRWARKDVIHPVTITEYTTEIPIPLKPFPASMAAGSRESAEVIYLMRSSGVRALNQRDVAFSVITFSNRTLYPLSRSIVGFVDKVNCIIDASLTETSANRFIQMVEGELSLVLQNPEAASIIEGTATMVNAVQATTTFKVVNPLARSHVFPMRPIRGSYMAVFPKSVAPGSYVIQYTGIAEVL